LLTWTLQGWSLLPQSLFHERIGPEWTSNHQCTSWLFYPLDRLHFFIRHQMGFITIHFFLLLTIVLFFFFLGVLGRFSHGPNLTHSYLAHFPTFISIALTLIPYLLPLTNIITVITSYPIDLATVLTTNPTNLATLLTTYFTNLTIVLITYPIDLNTLHTQPFYWHKYFTNLITLIR